jgi:hypothetical protein
VPTHRGFFVPVVHWWPPVLGARALGGVVSGIRSRPRTVFRPEAMSRSYKIALIRKSCSSLPVYRDLERLTDRELDEQVVAMVRRMRVNESAEIARMVMRQPTCSLN